MIVVLGSTEPELDAHRRLVSDVLHGNGGEDAVRIATPAPDATQRRAVIDGADLMICIVGTSIGPELPDGSGYAEAEAATARQLGVHVLAYSYEDGTEAMPPPAEPLRGYSVARARRFRNWLREHYGMRRFATPEELVAGVREDLDALRTERELAGPSLVQRIHTRLGARSTSLDAFAMTLHNMDAIYRVEQIAPYREERVDAPRRSPGGGGANIIYTLARLGVRTAIAGVVGDDADGTAVRSNLADAGVDTDLLVPVERAQTGRAIILVDARGRRAIFTESGANARLAAEVAERGLTRALQQGASSAKVVLLTSFRDQPERELQEDLLERLPADTVVAYTPGSLYLSPGATRLRSVIARTNVVFLSEEALGRLLDELIPHLTDQSATVPQKAHSLIQWRYDLGSRTPLMIVVRRQWRGYDARDGFRHISIMWGQKGYEGGAGTDGRLGSEDADTIVDGTGTGGALAGGVLYGLLRSRPPQDCANLGYVLAMSAATRYGSRDGIPARNELPRQWCHWLKVDAAPSWL